jgi:hypothetical protein
MCHRFLFTFRIIYDSKAKPSMQKSQIYIKQNSSVYKSLPCYTHHSHMILSNHLCPLVLSMSETGWVHSDCPSSLLYIVARLLLNHQLQCINNLDKIQIYDLIWYIALYSWKAEAFNTTEVLIILHVVYKLDDWKFMNNFFIKKKKGNKTIYYQ